MKEYKNYERRTDFLYTPVDAFISERIDLTDDIYLFIVDDQPYKEAVYFDKEMGNPFLVDGYILHKEEYKKNLQDPTFVAEVELSLNVMF